MGRRRRRGGRHQRKSSAPEPRARRKPMRGRRRGIKARSAEDTSESCADQEDKARCSDDTGGTSAEQEAETVGFLFGCDGRERHRGGVVSDGGCSGQGVRMQFNG